MKGEKLAAVFLAAAMLLGLAATAGAVDGTIEINQAKVNAAGGFPYFIFGSGSYRLTGNLIVSSTTADAAIDVQISNVTIDLNGFSITGPGVSASHNGVAGSGTSITVENGIVSGFQFGVNTLNNAIVKSVHADGNAVGIQTGQNSLIQGCTANGSTQDGIVAGGGSVVSGNTVNSGNGVGVQCNGSGCLITNNSIDSNKGAAILTSDSTTAYGWNVLNGDGAVSGGTSMAGKNTNSCGGSPC